ncbi:nitrogen fixation protein NifQ [Enterobacter sp. 9-2]
MMPVHDWLRRLLWLYAHGEGCYPLMMGLRAAEWDALQAQFDPPTQPMPADCLLRQKLMSELNATRSDEQQQLAQWLAGYMAPGAAPMHNIIASVSLAFNHLWQDLGLSSRQELRELMSDCFPLLVEMNSENMRWKKFFYRQRCLHSAGELICRSPSCDACYEREFCFSDS